MKMTQFHLLVIILLIFQGISCGGEGGGATDDTTVEIAEDAAEIEEEILLESHEEEETENYEDSDDISDTQEEEEPVYDPLCPSGLQCTEFTSDGYLACTVDGEIPPDSTTQCHLNPDGCPGNQACFYTNEEMTESVCITNCGQCPEGQTCSDVAGIGYMGCLENGRIPAGAQTGCHLESGGCSGNATCWYTNSQHTESVCIQNCSPPPPCTPGSCPEGQICVDGECILDIGEGPGPYPGTTCDLPPLECTGTAEYCGELIQFDPTYGVGYIDYPENGETWDNQYRSWLRRDVVMLIQYATAKVACLAQDWTSGNGAPLGLIDMSEQDGSIPGTSIGEPGHPEGTHTNGFDIDVAYYQNGTPDNRARPICNHYEGGVDAYHCTATPHLLDPWRTALFLGALFEHPYLRVVGCDGKAGPILDSAISILCSNGWITPYACTHRRLTYEEVNEGRGWYYFHHHHMHVSFRQPPYRSIVPSNEECLVPDCNPKHWSDFIDQFRDQLILAH